MEFDLAGHGHWSFDVGSEDAGCNKVAVGAHSPAKLLEEVDVAVGQSGAAGQELVADWDSWTEFHSS